MVSIGWVVLIARLIKSIFAGVDGSLGIMEKLRLVNVVNMSKQLKKDLIPKKEIKGLRFGQLIYNAIRYDKKEAQGGKIAIADVLFSIGNDELEKIIRKFLWEHYEIKDIEGLFN